MSLTERSRSALYQGLITVVDDEEAVEEMMSHFPARDVEEPVTKEFLRAEMSDLRAEISDLRADLRAEMVTMRTEITTDLRSELNRIAVLNLGTLAAFAGVIVAAVRL